MTERTLILIKPDGVKNGHVGEIISRIERKGLKLAELDLRVADRETAEKHYEEHKDKPFFGDLVEIDGTCRSGTVATPFGQVPTPGHAEGAAVTLCLRPEAIRLGAPGASLRAVVRARRFLGAAALLSLSADGLPEPLHLPVPADDPREPGDAVGLSLDPYRGFIFANEMD